VHYFVGIAELAITCAAAVDPRGLAISAYRQKIAGDDFETQQAVQRRRYIYELLIDVLAELHRLSCVDPNATHRRTQAESLSGPAAEIERNRLIDFILDNQDELCHYFLFQWVVQNCLEGLLILKKNAQFERFICR
jgi:stress-induced morphogen